MFFESRHFAKTGISEAHRNDVAKAAEETVIESSSVLYGRIIDGKWMNFTTHKKPFDTHVCFGTLPAEMGSLKPHKEFGSE